MIKQCRKFKFLIDKTEVTIGEFKLCQRNKLFISLAEKKEVDLCMKMDGFKKGWNGKGHMVWQLW